MHCHLDLMANAEFVAAQAAQWELDILSCTVLPEHAAADGVTFARSPHIHVACGLHPWWITDALDEAAVAQLMLQARTAQLIGEVGLDFSGAYEAHRTQQVLVFEELLQVCSTHPLPGRVLSIHAVRSATTVLDILERYQVPKQAACIFHWFSGTSDELTRARKAGCYFSVNERMLATKRGRAYTQAIERDRLLLETDFPPQQGELGSAHEIVDSLSRTLDTLAELRGEDRKMLGERIYDTSMGLLHP